MSPEAIREISYDHAAVIDFEQARLCNHVTWNIDYRIRVAVLQESVPDARCILERTYDLAE